MKNYIFPPTPRVALITGTRGGEMEQAAAYKIEKESLLSGNVNKYPVYIPLVCIMETGVVEWRFTPSAPKRKARTGRRRKQNE